jgi:large subunit ribosomal protein L18
LERPERNDRVWRASEPAAIIPSEARDLGRSPAVKKEAKQMLTKITKNQKRGHVHERIRKKLQGTAQRPRLNVYRSLNHIYAQVIDDMSGQTLVSASTAEGKIEDRRTGGNVAAAKSVGKTIAERAKAKGVTKVVFDRGGYIYHGRVKALADAAREAGLQF